MAKGVMKLIHSNGRVLRVYAWGDRPEGGPLMEFAARPEGPPLKLNGWRVLGDDVARDVVREIISSWAYDRIL